MCQWTYLSRLLTSAVLNEPAGNRIVLTQNDIHNMTVVSG